MTSFQRRNSSPGPHVHKFPYQLCEKWGLNCLQWNLCHMWHHVSCLGMQKSVYETLGTEQSLTWICCECGIPQFWNMSSSLYDHPGNHPSGTNYQASECSSISSIDDTSPVVKTPAQQQRRKTQLQGGIS